MDIFGIDPTQLSTQKLYRIQYDGCMTTFDRCSGFAARDTETFYNEDCDIYGDFGGAVKDHLSWHRSRPSIFISLFANKRHAENWALSWSARHNGDVCKIFEINALSLTECVYQAEEIRRSCCSHIPEAAKASIADEYLVAYHIPIQAVERSWTTEDVKRSKSLIFKMCK
jgi:hypothetical protein